MLCELNEQTFQKNILAKPGMQRMQSPTLHSVSQVNFERDTRDDSVQQLAQLTENFKKMSPYPLQLLPPKITGL